MNNIQLFSPCGKASVLCHPSKVEEMKASGWTEEKKIKTESKSKKEDK